ncbi:MAG: acyltransferase [Flavipsychrobacter sp.]|nr:acyltransferase [Flavipsychrobacter sp.]
MNKTPANLESKSHYQILDGLRGIAALMVVLYHIFQTYDNGDRFIQIVNHGYLAVDFFFVLSGFVVAYAYDSGWGTMTKWDFYKRRLIRLQPMAIMGMLIGAALFYFQSNVMSPLVNETPVWKMLLVLLAGVALIPLLPSVNIRSEHDMYPLNGPTWSLFFEYIANFLYALVFRKFSNTLLAIFVILFAGLLIRLTILGPQGDVMGGWSLYRADLALGFTRLLYPFFAGVLLSRMKKLIYIKNAFAVCSLLIVLILSVPRIGGREHLWMNGLYELFSILVLFPLIVAIGAGGNIMSKYSTRVCRFLGDISYPIFITHYPLIYLYKAWVANNNTSKSHELSIGFLLFISSIVIAYACLKLYDEPVRDWLKKYFL